MWETDHSSIAASLQAVPKTIDVLFYGDPHSERRQKFLTHLKSIFNVVVVGNLFGCELRQKIASAKVVINIHYYENALLESTRIFECLSLGAHVISETAADVVDYPGLDAAVDFVPVGDIAAMAERVAHGLNKLPLEFSSATCTYLHQTQNRVQFMLLRGLLALDVISYSNFLASTTYPMHEIMALSLPETLNRRMAWLANSLPGSQVFDGLRARPGWIGCALSLHALMRADFNPRICTPARLSAWCSFWGEAQGRPFYQELCGAKDAEYNLVLEALCARMNAEHGYAAHPQRAAASCA